MGGFVSFDKVFGLGISGSGWRLRIGYVVL